MNQDNEPRMADTLAVFESWLLKRRSDKYFRLTHPCDALDDASIVQCEDGGILSINIRILELFDGHTEKRDVPASQVPNIGFYDGPPAEPPKRVKNYDLEFPIRSSLEMKTCPDCRGDKKKTCHSCPSTNRKVKCYHCGGKGKISTRMKSWEFDMNGNLGWERKKMLLSEKICPKCSGVGITVCPKCGGYGFYDCKTCNGEGRVGSFDVAIQKYRAHQDTVRIVSEDSLTQSVNSQLDKPAYNSKFDTPLRFVEGNIQPAFRTTQYDSLTKCLIFNKMELSWPLSLKEFVAVTGVHSPGLARLFKQAESKYHASFSHFQKNKNKIARTAHSAVFTPISHLVFSEVRKYNKQMHFSLIGTPERYTVLPPKLTSLPYEIFLIIPFFVGLIGALLLFLPFRLNNPIPPDISEIPTRLLVLAVLILLSVVPILFKVPDVMKSLQPLKIKEINMTKKDIVTQGLKNRQTASGSPIGFEEGLLFLVGPDCPEKATLFSLLNYELCRKRWITISDLWIHRMLSMFLNSEMPRFGTSLLCKWDLHDDQTVKNEKRSKKFLKKTKKKRRIIHFLSAHPTLLQENKIKDKVPVLARTSGVIIFIKGEKEESTAKHLLRRYDANILRTLDIIASIRNINRENIPLFVIFDKCDAKSARETISTLNDNNIIPSWDIIDVNLMKTQYLEGQSGKYENFINKLWDFINPRG